MNSRTGGLRLAVAWPGTGTAVSITDRGRTCVLPGDRQSPVRLIGEFTDPASQETASVGCASKKFTRGDLTLKGHGSHPALKGHRRPFMVASLP